MDIQRKSSARKKNIKRAIYGLVVLILVGGITYALSKLKPALQTVDGNTLWMDTVKRGDMVRDVRGLGTLVPEDIQWIPSTTEGRVDKILHKPGDIMEPDTVVIELSNPTLQQELINAELAVKAAKAKYDDLKVQLQSSTLTQKSVAARAKSDYEGAQLTADRKTELLKDGLVSDLEQKLAVITAKNLLNQSEIEQRRYDITAASTKAQLDAEQASIDQLQEAYNLKKSQANDLHVKAGLSGVLQEVPVEVGAHVTPGTNLARVADPKKLKAELKIAETQARDVSLGQMASIDTRNGIISGRVIRKYPSAQNGTVTVDCSLEGTLPKGAVADLSVEGTIQLEKLDNIVYVGRPVHGQESSTVGLFKVMPDNTATRVQVKLGKASVNTIEVVEGLNPGDKVILSDTSAFDSADKIRISY